MSVYPFLKVKYRFGGILGDDALTASEEGCRLVGVMCGALRALFALEQLALGAFSCDTDSLGEVTRDLEWRGVVSFDDIIVALIW